MMVTSKTLSAAFASAATVCGAFLLLGSLGPASAAPPPGTVPTRIEVEADPGGTHPYVIQKQDGDNWVRATDATGTVNLTAVYPPSFLKLMTVWPEIAPQDPDTVLASGTHDISTTAGRTPLSTETHSAAFTTWTSGSPIFPNHPFFGTYGVSLDYSGDSTFQATHWEDLRTTPPPSGQTVSRLDITSGSKSGNTTPITVTLGEPGATGEVGFWCSPASDPDLATGSEAQQTAQLVGGSATFGCTTDLPGDYLAGVFYAGAGPHAMAVNLLRFDPAVASTSKGISTTDPLAPGQQAVCAASALAPNSEYECAFHSDPTILGRFTTNAQGNGQGVFAIPTNAPTGVHHFALTNVATGTVTHGAQFVVVAGVPVQPAPVTVTFGTGVPGPQFPPDPDPFGSLENVFGS